MPGDQGGPARATAPRPYDAVVARTGSGGGVIAVLACAALMTGGCAASHPRAGAPASSQPHSAATPGQSLQVAAGRYLAIAIAGNRRLEIDFDRLQGRDKGHLRAAAGDLRDAAATERLFDRRLLAIALPPATERIARLLYQVNQARASLTAAAARSVSLPQLRSYQRRLAAANEPVEEAVRVIRSQLGLPPPSTS